MVIDDKSVLNLSNNDCEVGYNTDCESNGSNSRVSGGSIGFTPTVTLTNESCVYAHAVKPVLVGYAFGKKKMNTMGMIMAEASMEFSLINEQSIRVSFVPLDLDMPIDEQHGGEFDVILHKMTEDILSSSSPKSKNRINSLVCYKKRRPLCCLVDEPQHILPVLGRDTMCNILKSCLVGVKTTSGLNVSTPYYLIITEQQQIRRLPGSLTYPVFVKPLAAAGSVQSHKMQILFSQDALNQIFPPVLLQQYTNHDSLLYKVYVLGHTTWVFPRKSLPNLPSTLTNLNLPSSYVEFDSQKPYPDLSAFCLQQTNNKKRLKTEPKISITPQEVEPLVQTLRKSFQLDIFGFDLLYTANSDSEGYGEIMVVDVNYFPSYKEVHNFPSYLARYLTERALHTRNLTR